MFVLEEIYLPRCISMTCILNTKHFLWGGENIGEEEAFNEQMRVKAFKQKNEVISTIIVIINFYGMLVISICFNKPIIYEYILFHLMKYTLMWSFYTKVNACFYWVVCFGTSIRNGSATKIYCTTVIWMEVLQHIESP